MTTYSGRHEDDDRLCTNWKHQKKYTSRKKDSVISESGYSSSNSKDDFLLSDQTNQSTSHFLTSYTQDSDTGNDDVSENNTEYKTTLSDKEFQTGTPKNQHENGSIKTPDIKQLESNNCDTVKLNTIQQSTSIQSSPKEQLKLTSSAHIKLNRLSSGEDEQRKQKRFNRTAKALRDSGLLPIAIQTGHLLKKNLILQKEIDKLKKEAEIFFKSLGSEENVPENISSDSSSSD